MLPDWSKEEIARDMLERAARLYGAERAEALRKPIEDTAGWLALVMAQPLELDGEEPDFLVAPAFREEGG